MPTSFAGEQVERVVWRAEHAEGARRAEPDLGQVADVVRFASFESADARSRSHDERDHPFGTGFGNVMTVHRRRTDTAVTGRAILDFGRTRSSSRSARQGFYAQTSYQVISDLNLAPVVNFERGARDFRAPTSTGVRRRPSNNRAAMG